MKRKIQQLIQYFIPSNIEQDEESLRRARLTAGTLLLIAYFSINYILISLLIDFQGGIISQGYIFILSIISLILYRSGFNRSLIYLFYFINCTIGISIAIYFSSGFMAVSFPWLASTPIVALMLWSKRGSIISLIFVIIVQFIFFYLHDNGYQFPNQLKTETYNGFKFSSEVGLVLILFWIAVVFENAKNSALTNLFKKNEEISEEKEKSEKLLLNILPEQVAQELKNTGKAKAKLFKDVSVLFIDFVGFTNFAENLSPEELVEEIDYCFQEFDRITEVHGLEKIKTVGDAYIAATGLPEPQHDHAERMIEAAIQMSEFMFKYKNQREQEGKDFFLYRIGINSGSVVAGIVGVKKFAYDIWGDAVNMAARMEQHGEPEKINVSEATYELLKANYSFEYRGMIDAKNKGKIKMYFLEKPIE